MKILVAGATGALGKQLVPRLVAAGHEVVGMTRSQAKRDTLRAMGATPVVADALDAEQVARAVAEANPEAIIHELTALAGQLDMRHFDRAFAQTNRLRTEGTDYLLSAGRAVGVRRFLAQSFAGWPYAREGAAVKDEQEPFDPNPPEAFRSCHAFLPRNETSIGQRVAFCGCAGLQGQQYRIGSFAMALIEAIDIKRKMFIEYENAPYHCLDVEVSRPTARGGQTLVRVKMRNLLTRAVFDRTFKAGEKFAEPDLVQISASYLYADNHGFNFMDQDTYETVTLPADTVGAGASDGAPAAAPADSAKGPGAMGGQGAPGKR